MTSGQHTLPEEWYTTQEAAQYLRISSRTIYKWCQQGRLPTYILVRRGQGRFARWILTRRRASWKNLGKTIRSSMRPITRLNPGTNHRLQCVVNPGPGHHVKGG